MTPAFGFVFSTSPQQLTIFVPLSLSSSNPDPNVTTPELITDMSAEENGLRIKKAGLYQVNYKVTFSLGQIDVAQLFLTLNGSTNAVPGTGTAVRSNVNGTGEVDVSSGLALLQLNPGDLIQITPVQVSGSPSALSADLTISQFE